jgi:hypothetical protein
VTDVKTRPRAAPERGALPDRPPEAYGGLSPEEWYLAEERLVRTLVRFWLRLLREHPGQSVP